MPAAYQLKGLREKRAKLLTDIRAIGDKLKAEGRAMSADEREVFEKLKTDASAAAENIRAVEADIAALDAAGGTDDPPAGEQQNSGRQGAGRSNTPPPGDPKRRSQVTGEQRRLAFQAWALRQYDRPLSKQHRAACASLKLSPSARTFRFKLMGTQELRRFYRGEHRDNSLTATAGGDFVAPEFSYVFEKAMKDFSNVRGVCATFRTDTGADMPYPTIDDTSNVGEALDENTAGNAQDFVTGKVTFKAYKYGSKPMLVSFELMNDSAFDLESLVAELAGERLGRITGTRYTTGDNSGKPQGIVHGASAGLTAASATAVTVPEVVQLIHKVDPAYRTSPSFGVMCNDNTLSYLALLRDGNGNPLLMANFRDSGVDVVYGKKVYPNQFMADIGASAVPIIAGDFSKYVIRDIGEVRFRRLDERYAEKDQTGFIAFIRTDGRYINTAAVKKLTNAAS